MNTQILPADDHSCGWFEILAPRREPLRLEGEQGADWAVLGAGLTGLAAARRLAELRPQDRVVVVEAERAGEGASGRNSGFMVDVSTPRKTLDPGTDELYRRKQAVNMAAIDYLRETVTANAIDCQWSQTGKYHCAADPANFPQVQALAEFCRRLGFAHEVLDAGALQQRLGIGYYHSAVYTPHNVLVQPAALTRGLALSLPESVSLYEQSPVTAMEFGPVIRLQCPQGTLKVRHLILAANAFLPGLGVLRHRLMPLTLTASMTRVLRPEERPGPGADEDWGVLSAHPTGATVRYTKDQRVVIRNTSEFWPSMSMSPTDLASRRRIHEQSLRARFPRIDGPAIDYTWSGVVCVSANGMPYFGKLENNVYASGGYNGSGVARGSLAGRLLVDYALGVDSEVLDHLLKGPQPTWIPPRPFLDLGAHWNIARARKGVGRDQ